MRKMTFQEKVDERQQLLEQAQVRLEAMNRTQLRRFINYKPKVSAVTPPVEKA
jgi:hypothetical protein